MLIDWHSHHTAPEVAEKVAQAGGPSQRTDPQDSIDFGKRVGDMDDAGIDVQIVSQGGGLNADGFTPEVAMALVRTSNDVVANRIAPYAGRLLGSVAITYKDPAGSAREIARMSDEGFRSVMIYANGDLVTRPETEPIFAEAHERSMPIFLHGGGRERRDHQASNV